LKKCKNNITIIRSYARISIIIIIAFAIILATTSCCFDLSKLMESKSEKITFTFDPENNTFETDKIDTDGTGIQFENKNIDYTEIKEELSDPSGFEITNDEEEEFFSNLEKIYPEDKFILASQYLKSFKGLYPSGYFTLIKVTQVHDYSLGYGWFELFESNSILGYEDFNSVYGSDIAVITHEMTHSGSGPFISNFVSDLTDFYFWQDYSFLIGNKSVLVERDRTFFSKYELFDDIIDPDHFDRTYLEPQGPIEVEGQQIEVGEVDFTNLLDELNAYAVSAKCAVATEQYAGYASSSGERFGLLKQMSHLELYLQKLNEKYPDDWDYLAGNDGFSFLIMKLWYEAEKMESAIKDDTRFNLNSSDVAEFVYDPVNYGIIEKLFDESGVTDYKNIGFDEINGQFENISVYDI